ncbi:MULTISPECIES: alkene reductase [unclassified Frondihabitans]|uniref:alkene reductase n=1 Tax=unclassified Frondihabitans TaxID=2626248 RepID=UPI000F5132CE|nr:MULTISPECIES: alkene reductase [unclassified Frondihabitans]RPE77837.1 2,4-dienoyl-CoA reductase-like NADH-dependent reductase (Old Yellow Enzyme family) [Frondihabitans sp. PhB153]RPF08116.1 2,4-dienoyl-CoA reductase-like NADH-dependent reductase (Old Yellow Enzyme family) [Frondihabitans sp. PhB161]
MPSSSALWQPFTLGRLRLNHRLALAPMTRSRAEADGTPGALVAEYYGQRASLGLLISEGTQPSDDGQGYLNTPGIYTPGHTAGWRHVADAIHSAGGHLFIQLMHVGRISHPDNTPHHRQPIAPSPIAANQDMFTPSGLQATPEPRQMTPGDIADVIGQFRHAAASAIEAGADGVEIHAANGYLLHQFLSPNANKRSDSYGGSVENRSRFVVEVACAVAEEIGADRTGIRISPAFPLGGIDEGDVTSVHAQYNDLVGRLADLNLAYLHVHHLGDDDLLLSFRKAWPTAVLVVRYGRTREQLGADIEADYADIAPLGRFALANPDIVERLRSDAAINEVDPDTVYAGGASGYTDYPVLTKN